MHGNKGIILANRDARKYIEILRNTLDIFSLGQLNTTRVFFWLSAIWDSGLLRILAIYSSIYHLHITLSFSLDPDHFLYELEGLPHTLEGEGPASQPLSG